MVRTTGILKQELVEYANPQGRIGRLVDDGALLPLIRGLYEDDPAAPGVCLAGCICGPSYLSFEYALSRHGLIPEGVASFTSATCGKRKTKRFRNAFGSFEYRDVPKAVFALGVTLHRQGGYAYWMATPEKALCDQLHKLPPASNRSELQSLLFDDLRIDEDALTALSALETERIAQRYRCGNVTLLAKFLKRVVS